MNRDEAKRERERMAAEHPESTWLIAEQASGDWQVVKVSIPSGDATRVEATEERPTPPFLTDPRSHLGRNTPYGGL